MAEYFEHYPTAVDELVGIASQLFRQARDPGDLVKDVSQGVKRAVDAMDGEPTFPMERSDAPVVTSGTNVAEAARFASGCVIAFATAAKKYNDGIDRLNAQIPAGNAAAAAERLPALRAEQARLERDLDGEAARVAHMLERGPNPTDLAFLRKNGFVPGDPSVLASVPPMPQDNPMAVRAWWDRLSAAQKAALMAIDPEWLGGTKGLPAEARDEANRIMLRENYESLMAKKEDGKLTAEDKRALANVERVMEQLEAREGKVDPLTGEPVPVQLYIYHPWAFHGDGRVAISFGDLDEADHVGVNVRGGTNVKSLTGEDVPRSINMYDESRFASGDSVAVLDWMGYDAPNTGTDDAGWSDRFDAARPGMARSGAELLAGDIDGLVASRTDDPAHLTVIGHSYGSTVAAIAAKDYGMDEPDDLVFIGSPGIPADHADDLPTKHDHTWVGAASRDTVSTTYGDIMALGGDPAEHSFGAIRFRAEHVNRDSADSDNHSETYYGQDSEGLANIAAIVSGEYGKVGEAGPRDFGFGDQGPVDPERDRQPHEVTHEPPSYTRPPNLEADQEPHQRSQVGLP